MLDGIPARGLDDSQPDALEHAGCGSRSPWAVCQTHPQAENWALANLTRQGFTAYLPLHLVVRRDPVLRTMTRQVLAPLYAGYLFVQPGTHWGPIRHSRGVSKLLMNGERPNLCPRGAVEALEASEASRRAPQAESATWLPGASCAVANGPLAAHHGVIVRTTASHAVVALMLLGRLVEASVRLDALARPAA